MKQIDEDETSFSGSDNNEIMQDAETKEFFDSIVSILAKDGYYTQTENNSIFFSHGNYRYAVHIIEARSLLIECKVLDFIEDELFFFLRFVNHQNWNFNFTRFLVDEEDNEKIIIARTWYPVNDSANVSRTFWGAIYATSSSVADFINKLNNYDKNSNK